MDGYVLFLSESFEPVQEEIQRELELGLVVATWTHDRLSVVGGRPGDRRDVKIPPRHLLGHVGGNFSWGFADLSTQSNVADAIRYVETGHARGKVVISVSAAANAQLEERSA